jgi:hypothetical protein
MKSHHRNHLKKELVIVRKIFPFKDKIRSHLYRISIKILLILNLVCREKSPQSPGEVCNFDADDIKAAKAQLLLPGVSNIGSW